MTPNVLLAIQGPGGGAWAVVRNLARGLAGRANVFVGLSCKRGTCEAARAEAARLSWPVFEHEVPLDFPGAYGVLVPPVPRWVRQIERACPASPTVVHLHNGAGVGALALGRWFRRNARRCIVTFHGIPPRDHPAIRPGRDLRLRLHGRLVRRMHRLGSVLAAVSRASAAQLAGRYGLPPDAFVAVPNGVPGPGEAADLGPLTPPLSHKERGNLGQPLTAGFIGALSDAKGWDLAVEAVRQLAATGRPVRLLIAGGGPGRPAVEAAARRSPGLITYLGRLPSEEVGALLARLDVLVLPSASEGMPLAVLEAMAHGVPCVATRVGGVAECAEGCGILVEERSAGAVASALARLADDPALRQALGRTAAARHRAAFSVEAMTERYMHIYSRIGERPCAERLACCATN